MNVRFDPMYELYTGKSVLAVMESALGSSRRFEKTIYLDMLKLYYLSGEVAVNHLVDDLPPLKKRKLFSYMKDNHISIKTSGNVITVLPDVIYAHEPSLEYAETARRITDAVKEYRELTAEELCYIVAWQRESGIDENGFVGAVGEAYRLDPSMTLENLIDYLQNNTIRSNNSDYEKTYAVALELLSMMNADQKSPDQEKTDFVQSWLDMGFTKEEIIRACSSITDTPSFAYLDAVLKNAKKTMSVAGVDTFEELEEKTKAYKNITGAKGKEGYEADNIKRYCLLEKSYDHELIQFAAESVREEEGNKIAYSLNYMIYVQRKLESWNMENIKDKFLIHRFIQATNENRKLVKQILEITGETSSKQTRQKYMEAVKKWINRGYSANQILAAAKETSPAKNPVAYMDKVLKNMPEESELPM